MVNCIECGVEVVNAGLLDCEECNCTGYDELMNKPCAICEGLGFHNIGDDYVLCNKCEALSACNVNGVYEIVDIDDTEEEDETYD